MYNVLYSKLYYYFNIGNVLQSIIYKTLTYLCTLHEYHVIYSVIICGFT